MRILFGPEHDGLHVDPARPGAYEWWYFDALSDDGRYALVVIYFLGSPMAPYYKAVVDGKQPDPRDWCGVFVSLHEKRKGRWRERAYAYNLYRGGEFASAPTVQVGGSRVRFDAPGTWTLDVRERGLWLGETRVEATFTATGEPLSRPPMGDKSDDASHAWVCVAPVCRVEATVTLPNGQPVRFTGDGYHDHNFGQLPWSDVDGWYWGRAYRAAASDGEPHCAILYNLSGVGPAGEQAAHLFLFDRATTLLNAPECTTAGPMAFIRRQPGRYGFIYPYIPVGWASPPRNSADGGASFQAWSEFREDAAFLEGPFYRRVPFQIEAERHDDRRTRPARYAFREGIGEVFRPAGLCGPVASRAMWTRIRRRG